jgi:cystathionine gamma-lyase
VSSNAHADPREICLSTSFEQRDINQPFGPYDYIRSDNPNRESFEIAIAKLENARYAVAFSSGLAATATIMQGLASNGHIISIANLYGGTYRYLIRVAEAQGLSASFTTNIESELEGLIQENTKLIWIESPSNPTLSLVDIKLVTRVARKHRIPVVVDNTFLSPYLQTPLDFDADIVLHSVTKSINGHDVCFYWAPSH